MRTLFSSVAVAAACFAAIWAQTDGLEAFTSESKRRLSISRQPRPVVAVEFQTQRSETLGWDAFRGRYVIADFIYTRCGSVCHALGIEFSQIQKQAADLIADGQLHLLSVSFDAANDTPAQLGGYLARFGGDPGSWTAARVLDARGERRLFEQFGIVVLPDGAGGYAHNAALHLISPDGELMQVVDYGESDELIAWLRRGAG